MSKTELIAVLICLGLVFGLLFGVHLLTKASCNVKAVSFDEHRYTLVGGCMVKHNGRWLPLENIRGFDDK